MAFHKTVFGQFGEHLPCDMDGYVPEDGDTEGMFVFASGEAPDPDDWEEWVEDAVEAAEAAGAALRRWRKEEE